MYKWEKTYNVLVEVEAFIKIAATDKNEAERLAREQVLGCLENAGFSPEILHAGAYEDDSKMTAKFWEVQDD